MSGGDSSGFLGDTFGGPFGTNIQDSYDPWNASSNQLRYAFLGPAAALYHHGGPPDYTASNLLAGITQQQWQNYKSTYEPIEDKLISYATDPGTIAKAQAQAGAGADASSRTAMQGLQKSLEGQGIKLDKTENASLQRKTGLQAGLAKVNAMNRAGQQTYDTVTSVLSGGAPSTSNIGNPANISQVV